MACEWPIMATLQFLKTQYLFSKLEMLGLGETAESLQVWPGSQGARELGTGVH